MPSPEGRNDYIYVLYYQVVEARYKKVKANNKEQAIEKSERWLRMKYGDRAIMDGVIKQKLQGSLGIEPSEEVLE